MRYRFPNYVVLGMGASVVAGVLIVLVAVTVTGHVWRPHSGLNARFENSPSLALPVTVNEAQDNSETIEAEVITIRSTGFEPTTITRDKGKFLLVVHNRSGLREVVLRLDRETGGRLHDVRVPREKLDWNVQVDLHPGRYVLTEANHADWVCHITINAR